MSKRKTKNPTTKVVGSLLVLGALGLAGLAAYVRYAPASEVPPEMRRTEPEVAVQQSPVEPADESKVQIFLPKWEGEELTFTEKSLEVPTGEKAEVFAINQFLKHSQVVDPASRCLGIDVKDGVARVDLNPAMQRTYGSFDEKTVLHGLLTTLGQFPSIEKAQFFVEGEPIETFGSVEIKDPQPVMRPASKNS